MAGEFLHTGRMEVWLSGIVAAIVGAVAAGCISYLLWARQKRQADQDRLVAKQDAVLDQVTNHLVRIRQFVRTVPEQANKAAEESWTGGLMDLLHAAEASVGQISDPVLHEEVDEIVENLGRWQYMEATFRKYQSRAYVLDEAVAQALEYIRAYRHGEKPDESEVYDEASEAHWAEFGRGLLPDE